MSRSLVDLSPYDEDRALRVVVETPKGATVKLAYKPELLTFRVTRGLPLGITYPYDWGFIPGTEASDGDPVDALVLHEGATYPGAVLPCEVLGMVEVSQDGPGGKRETNNRIIAKPCWDDRMGDLERAKDLPKQIRLELEQFFLSVTFFTAKNAKIEGWKGPTAATAFIRAHALTSSSSKQ